MIKFKKQRKYKLPFGFIIFAMFFAGILFGFYLGPHTEVTNYLRSELKEHFGILTQDCEYQQLGRILWIPRSFPVIMQDGVKTIRASR